MSGVFSGSGSLTKSGSGTLLLSGANTYSGGTTVSAGALQGTTSSLQGTITNNASVIFDQTTTGTYSGNMFGTGSFNKLGSGTITLNGANTYSGGTTVSAGALQGTTSSLQGAIINNASVIFDQTTTGTYSGNMFGTGSFNKLGSGTITLNGANTYSGGTTVSAGALQGTTSSLQGAITNSASVIFDQTTTGTYSGNMSGTGSFDKLGSGTVTLSGANTYSGGTAVSAGTLQGTTSSLQGAITNNALVIFDQTTTGTYSGNMSGTGSFNKLGSGTITLSGANTYSGGTAVSAGTLQGTTSSLQGAITNNALVIFDQTTTGTYSGNMSGTGSFNKLGSGTITLSGANTYSGGTAVSAGTLQGTTSSLQGAITNNALVIFDQTTTGTYSGNMSGTGSFNKLGSGTITLSGANTYSGGTTVSAGTLQGTTSSLQGAITNNASVIFDQTTTGTYSGNISGGGDLTKNGSGKVTLSATNTFLGMTKIQGGTLEVKGSLISPVIVFPLTFLQGMGTVGTVQNSGTVSPGSSIGTLIITGDYTQAASGSLVIEIDDDPLASDLLLISGTANLDGSVILNPLPGFYEAGTTYTFLTASAISGQFAQLLETQPLDFILKYLPNAVQIHIAFTEAVLPTPIDDLNGNSKKIAEYLFACNSIHSNDLVSILKPLVKLPAEEFSNALLELSPQQFGGLSLSNLQTSVRIARSMNRTNDSYENYFSTCSKPSKEKKNEFSQLIWFNPIGYYYKQTEMQEQVPFNSKTYGFTTGFSTCLFNHLIVSAGTGYTYSSLNWYENNGDAHIQSVYLSPSVGYIGEYGYAGVALLGARSLYDVNRKIQFSNIRETAHNNHKSYDGLIGISGGLKLKFPEKLQKNLFLMPTLNLDYLNIFEKGYQESGAGPVSLSIRNIHSAFLRPEFKLKLLKELNTETTCFLPSIYVGWLRNIPLKNGKYTSRFYKQEACEGNFTVQSYHISTDQLALGAEASLFYKDNCSLSIGYEANIGNHYSVQEGRLNFNWNF